MRIVIITDTFPKLCIAGAVILTDKIREFSSKEFKITVVLPTVVLSKEKSRFA